MPPTTESLPRKLGGTVLEAGVVVASLASLASLILEWGFPLERDSIVLLHRVDLGILGFFLFQLVGRLVLARRKLEYLGKFRLEYALGVVLAAVLCWAYQLGDAGGWTTSKASQLTKAYLASTQLLIGAFMLLGLARASRVLAKLNIQPAKLVAASFLFAIAAGAALLMLPKAQLYELSWTDAFFLSTSAVCVTGLSTVDITQVLSFNGQVILLLLIQMGGLGIMTLAGGIGILFGGMGGMKQRMLLRDIMGHEGVERVRDLLARIMSLTLALELLGALWLWFSWQNQIPDDAERAWIAVFHSISAFCNAGFSNLPAGLASPAFSQSLPGLAGLMVLVALGSSGCLALFEVLAKGLKPRSFSHSTRLTLRTHYGLFGLATLLIWGAEYAFSHWHVIPGSSWTNAAMLSFMPRTAGFQNIDLTLLGAPTLMIMILLMIIGGAPGSTAGGIKINAFVALVCYMRSLIRGEEQVRMGRRELAPDTCLRAMALFLLYGLLLLTATTLLLLNEGMELMPALFEVVSALSTVGLSLNVTPHLGEASKWLLMACMFVGRLGFITVLWALFERGNDSTVRHPREPLPLF